MSKFFTTSDTVTKQLDDDHSITFKKLGYGKRQNLISRCSKVNPFTQEAEIDFARLAIETFKARIVSWSGPEFEGFACTPENVEALDPDTAQEILALMGETNEELTEEEKKA